MKLVSVLMTVYNEEVCWLVDSIESILNQDYSNIEFVIIVDNPSNKAAITLIRKYQLNDNRVKCVVNDENIGLVKSLNKGLNISSGIYIARMDADDFCEISRIGKQVELIEFGRYSLVGCNTIRVDVDKNEIERYNSEISIIKQRGLICLGSILPHPTWLFKKDIIGEIGDYNDIDYAEDYDFLSKLISNNLEIGIVPEYLFYNRINPYSVSSKHHYEQSLSHFYVVIINALRRVGVLSIDKNLTFKPKSTPVAFKKLHNKAYQMFLNTRGSKGFLCTLKKIASLTLSPLLLVRSILVILSKIIMKV